MRKLTFALVTIVLILIFGIPFWVCGGISNGNLQGEQDSPPIKVLNKATGQETIMPLEKYLVGVVAAEMPAAFEMEALQAQAVAARTYALKRMYKFGGKPAEGHLESEICTDPVHCQAWIDDSEMKQKWSKVKYYLYTAKIKEAVASTKGLVITYRGELIEPVYHGSCGGKGTENSEEVWSNVIPYLRGVTCESEYRGSEQVTVKEFNKAELTESLRKAGANAVPTVSQQQPFIEPVSVSANGRIKEAKLNGVRISGVRLRQILGLTSTFLTWESEGAEIIFKSIGKGHAVGLCQYGANGLALTGVGYKAIIQHYYTGVQIQKAKY